MLEEGNSQYRLSQVPKYFHPSSRTKFWFIQLLKMPILLLLPYEIYTNSYTRYFELWMTSFFWYYNSTSGLYFEFNIFILLPAYILTIPGFYYAHKLRQADPEKTHWKMGVGIAAVSQLLPGFIPVPVILPVYDIYYPYWMLYSLVPFYVVIGYVITPLLNRKIQNVIHSYNRGKRVSSRRERIRRIHFPLWITILFLMIGPVIVIVNAYSYSVSSTSFTIFSLFIYTYGYMDVYDGSNSLNMMMAYNPYMYLITGIFCLFNLLFVKHLIRYFLGKCSQMDVFKYGIVGAIWPFIFFYIIESLFVPASYRSSAIPLPLLIIVGIIAIRMGDPVHRVCSRVADQIWEDEEIVTPVPDEIFDVVKVPIWYTLISRFRKNQRTYGSPEKIVSPRIEESLSDEIKVPWWYSIVSRFRKMEDKAWDPDEQLEDPWLSEKSE